MLELSLGAPARPLQTLLCLGAHCDDIEIGCGGTILTLTEQNPDLMVHWVVLSSSPVRADEARRSADQFLRHARQRDVIVKDFQTSFFPFIGAQIKEFFEELKARVSPDLILTHTRQDSHQDHRLTNELTWNTFRNHFILEYEIPKFDGDLGAPSVFMPLDITECNEKIEHLLECFATQRDKHWFTRDLFLGLMRLRGMEANTPSGFAEAFYCRKLCLRAAGAPIG